MAERLSRRQFSANPAFRPEFRFHVITQMVGDMSYIGPNLGFQRTQAGPAHAEFGINRSVQIQIVEDAIYLLNFLSRFLKEQSPDAGFGVVEFTPQTHIRPLFRQVLRDSFALRSEKFQPDAD